MLEVTPQKKLVWTYKSRPGARRAQSSQILTTNGRPNPRRR